MRRICAFLMFLSLLAFYPKAQTSPAEALERDAVEITNRSEANDSVFSRIKDYKAILVGCVPGTKEPPEFFLGLIKTMVKHGKKVLAAVEYPSDGVDFSVELSHNSLRKMPAFSSDTRDGRQSIAWADMLIELKRTGVDIVCFDLPREHKGEMRSHRDSLMYSFINAALLKDTSMVLISLSGNIVSRLTPYHKVKTMGCYLKEEEASFLKGKKILSLNYMYNDGTAYNWMNNGYKLRNMEGNAGFYGAASPYENYLLIYPAQEGYNGILFSTTITASGPLVELKK